MNHEHNVVDINNVNYSRLNGLAVGPGDDAAAICDLSNEPLQNGDDVQALATVADDGSLSVSYVCSTSLDLDPTPEERAAGKVTLNASLTTAAFFPNQLVLTDVRLAGSSR